MLKILLTNPNGYFYKPDGNMEKELHRKLEDWDKDVGVIGIKVKVESWEYMKWTEEGEQKETAEIDGRQELEPYPHLNNRKRR